MATDRPVRDSKGLHLPGKGPDEVGKVLGVEAREFGSSLRGEDV